MYWWLTALKLATMAFVQLKAFCIDIPQIDKLEDDTWIKITRRRCYIRNQDLTDLLTRPQSRAITFLGYLSDCAEESRGERSNGKEQNAKWLSPFSLFFPSLPARTLRSFPSSPSRASLLSPPLALLACSVLHTKPWKSLWRRQSDLTNSDRHCEYVKTVKPLASDQPKCQDLGAYNLHKSTRVEILRINITLQNLTRWRNDLPQSKSKSAEHTKIACHIFWRFPNGMARKTSFSNRNFRFPT